MRANNFHNKQLTNQNGAIPVCLPRLRRVGAGRQEGAMRVVRRCVQVQKLMR